jgi:ribose transport system permease protein
MALASTRRFEIGDNWPVFVFAGLFIVVIALKGRYSLFDLRALAVNAMPLALIALGQFVIVLARGIDLSLGPVASVAGAVMALTVTGNPALGFLAPVAIGLGAGLLNGVFVARFGLPAIIVTLATMSIWQGIAVLILPDPGGSVPAGIQQALIGGFSEPLAGLAALVVACLAVTWLLGTRFGMHLRAVGGDEQAARMSGVRVDGVGLPLTPLAACSPRSAACIWRLPRRAARRLSATATSLPRSRRSSLAACRSPAGAALRWVWWWARSY